jgi:hypothetical protein
MFENRVLRGVFGHNGGEVTGGIMSSFTICESKLKLSL